MGIGVSNEAIRYSKDSVFDIASLSNQLKDWNVNSLAVKLTKDQLPEIPYPAIAHLNAFGGRFVVLHKLLDRKIYYTDPTTGTISKSVEDFSKDWSGVLLLLETTEKSGEAGYEQKHKQEVFEQWSLYISFFLLVALWMLPLLSIEPHLLAIYGLNGLGAVISYLLLQKQFGLGGSALNSFCKLGSKSDCDSVINSPASKLFGILNLSELGLWYFAGSILSMAVAAISLVSVTPFLFVFTLLATVLSSLAVYYQALVIKKWCPLCLAVVAVIWVQAAIYLLSPPAMVLNFKSISVLFIGFSLLLVFWLTVRKRFIGSLKVPNLQCNLNRFLKSERVFQKLLEEQPYVETATFTHELQSGPSDASVQVVVVSNPQCGPCAYTHFVLDNLKESLDEKVNLIYRFTLNTQNKSAAAYQMLETLFSIQQQESNEKALRALSGWYLANGNLEDWKRKFLLQQQQESDVVAEILKRHEQWCARVAIEKTPTLFINGRALPEEFSVNELKFQLRKLAEKITEPEPIS
ncbi:MAG: thioredoxin domain-containing protein [Cyclobacteriaceae bacterium]|nr:thioredoxin domain-containing protein [Cyclobacteriaceae bacterium]